MPVQLVRDAIQRSRTRDPLVTAMALLTRSNVLAYMDLPAAKRAFAEGVTAFEKIPFDPRISQYLRQDIVGLGVPADPETAIAIYKQSDFGHEFRVFDGHELINALAQHGFTSLALDLLGDLRYPVEGAGALMLANPDLTFQRRVLAAAKARWHLPRRSRRSDSFYPLFSRHFRVLEADQASGWLDELLTRVVTMPNDAISAGFGDSVRMDTLRDMHLFQLLNVLRALRPPSFVDALLRKYPAVGEGAKVYPLGVESMVSQGPSTQSKQGFCGVSVSGNASMLFAPSTSVARLLEEAHHLYIEDVNSNDAPRPFWPSAHAYKQALYWAGQREGSDGARHLQSIPDTDIAILAGIQLAAGILGLPYRSGPQQTRPKR
ncbi:MAG: hypothetical protein ACKV2U_07060 [Bryobacteraceae bacterium]